MTAYGASSRQPLQLNGKRVEHGTTRRLKDGTVVYEFTPPRVNGKKSSPQVLKGVTTPTDAKREIERLLPLTRTGKIGDRSVRLRPLYEDCLAAMKSGEFTHSDGTYSKRSIELFEQRANDHVLPLLGESVKVADITAAHLRAMMTRLKAKGLGGSAVRGSVSTASTMLRYAVSQEIVSENQANLIGRGERPSAKRMTEPRYLSVEEVELLLSKVTDRTTGAALASMFWGALRISEALELRWSDVGENTLLVRGTKTKGSWGEVPLLPQLKAVLAAHRTRMGKLGFDRLKPDALVFQTRTGNALGRRNVSRSLALAASAAGLNPKELPPVGCHDLRHSMAGIALDLPNMNMVKVAKLLRHANPQVTATVYAGLSDSGTKQLGAELAAGFGA